jgi:catechol 2,3-dioxygenase-like lactoylglutathione lyase family enzyme
MILLDDLLAAPNFRQAAEALARDFRATHDLPLLYQVGLVAPDVQAATQALAGRDVGPFFIAEGEPAFWKVDGRNSRAPIRAGFAFHEGVQLECVEPGARRDLYRSYQDPQGRIVVHHLGLWVPDVDEWSQRMDEAGYPVQLRGRFQRGPVVADFAWIDSEAAAGIIIEFVSLRLFGWPYRPGPFLTHLTGYIQQWIGPSVFRF